MMDDLRKRNVKKGINKTIFYILILFVAFIIVTPIYFLVSISFMSDQEAYDWPFPLGIDFFGNFSVQPAEEEGEYIVSFYSNTQGKYTTLIQGKKFDEISDFLKDKTNCDVPVEKLREAAENVDRLVSQNSDKISVLTAELASSNKTLLKVNQDIVKAKRQLKLVEGKESMKSIEEGLIANLAQYEKTKTEAETEIERLEKEIEPYNSVRFRVTKDMFANYVTFFKVTRDALPALFRSIQVALLTVLISLTIGGTAGYAFARYRFKGKNMLKLSTLFVRMFPGIAIAMPMVIILAEMGFYDQPLGLSLVYSVGQIGLTIWITASIFMGIPVELEEAAQVFGRSKFGAFIYVTLPLALPGLAASAMYAFIGSWAETAQAIVLTQFNPTFPVVVYQTMVGAKGMVNLIAAGGVAMALPAVTFTILIRRYMLQMWGGVKV